MGGEHSFDEYTRACGSVCEVSAEIGGPDEHHPGKEFGGQPTCGHGKDVEVIPRERAPT